jgi:hypothetical protein
MTQGLAMKLCMSWINNRFTVAAVRRDLFNTWMGFLVDGACASGFPSSGSLSETPSSLLHLVPTDKTITHVLQSVWLSLVKPGTAARDAAAAQFDG